MKSLGYWTHGLLVGIGISLLSFSLIYRFSGKRRNGWRGTSSSSISTLAAFSIEFKEKESPRARKGSIREFDYISARFFHYIVIRMTFIALFEVVRGKWGKWLKRREQSEREIMRNGESQRKEGDCINYHLRKQTSIPSQSIDLHHCSRHSLCSSSVFVLCAKMTKMCDGGAYQRNAEASPISKSPPSQSQPKVRLYFFFCKNSKFCAINKKISK